MHERIREIAESLARLDGERRRIADGLREKNIAVLPDALERGMIHAVGRQPPEIDAAAVDGGLLAQEFHGFSLILSRAVAVMFSYREGKLAECRYWPSAIPEPDVLPVYAMDTHEFQRFKSLFRLEKEIACAIAACERFGPRFIFLDGSLLPQIADKPGSDEREAKELYDRVVALYARLYALCEHAGIRLVGVIKDSRGRRFIEILERMLVENEREVMRKSSDTAFLSFLLREGERTASFAYASSEKEHVVLKDLAEWGTKIAVFYCRPVAGDRPLRVEYLSGAAVSAGEIASVVSGLSRINKRYAYPAVLIEADLRAALNPIELERAYKDVCAHAGLPPSAMQLRRDSRPFR